MVKEGKYTGGNVPFGYRLVPSGELNKYGRMLKKLEIVSEEAEIVRFIFEKTTVEAVGSHIMASMINELGVRIHNGASFQSNTINRILRNPIFCGYYYRSGIISPRQEELRIIDDATYNEAQRILNGRTRKSSENVPLFSKGSSLLSGNVFCGFCNSKMILTTHTYSYKTVDGQIHRRKRLRYMCVGRSMCRNDCKGQGTFTARNVDSQVEEYLRDLYRHVTKSESVILLQEKYDRAIETRKKQIKKYETEYSLLNSKIRALYTEVPDSVMGKSSFSPDLLTEVITELRNQQSELQAELEMKKSEVSDEKQLQTTLRFRLDEMKRLLRRFFENNVTLAEKRMIVNKLFEKVVVQRGTKAEYDIRYCVRDDFSDYIE